MTVTVTTATLLTLLWHFAISLTSGILPLNSGILPFVSPLAFCHSSGELCLMLMFQIVACEDEEGSAKSSAFWTAARRPAGADDFEKILAA